MTSSFISPLRTGLLSCCYLLAGILPAQSPASDSEEELLAVLISDSTMVQAITAYTVYDSLMKAGAYDLPADISLASWETITDHPDLAAEVFMHAGYREWRAMGEAWRVTHTGMDHVRRLVEPYAEVLSTETLNRVLRAVYARLGITPVGNLD